MMYDRGKSDDLVVPAKLANNAWDRAAVSTDSRGSVGCRGGGVIRRVGPVRWCRPR